MVLQLKRRKIVANVPAVTEPQAPPAKVVAPARRLLFAAKAKAAQDATRQAALDELKLISRIDAEVEGKLSERAASLARLDTVLREGNVSGPVVGHGLSAELVEGFTRQMRNIDPRKFRNAVECEAFWGSIEVSVMKAKQFLGEKELNSISDVVPAKSTGIRLRVEEYNPDKKGKK